MTTATTAVSTRREPELLGIGLETARRARAEGQRHPHRAQSRTPQASGARARRAAHRGLRQSFFQDLPTRIDDVMVTAGAPHYGPPLEMPPEEARRSLTEHFLLALEVARGAADKVRPPGSLVFMGGTGARRPRAGLGIERWVVFKTGVLDHSAIHPESFAGAF